MTGVQSNVILLFFVARFCEGFGGRFCGKFTYHNRPEFDNITFTQGKIQVKTNISGSECFSDCFFNESCNMVLVNPTTRECQFFSTAFSDLTYATSSTGFKYYGAGCNVSKSAPAAVCQPQFAPFGGSTMAAQCYQNGQWVDNSSTIPNCKRIEWIDTTETSLQLPSPVVTGLVIDIRGAWQANTDLLCTLRQSGSTPETILLRVLPGGDSLIGVYDGSSWASTIYVNPFPLAGGVVFDLQVVFTDTQYQVTLNGNAFATDILHNPKEISTFLQMFNWSPLESVKLTYP